MNRSYYQSFLLPLGAAALTLTAACQSTQESSSTASNAASASKSTAAESSSKDWKKTSMGGSSSASTSPSASMASGGSTSTTDFGTRKPSSDKGSSRPVEASMKTRAGRAYASMAFPTGDERTSALLLERSAPAEIVAGVPVTYEILVTNLTDMDLDSVRVMEGMPAGFEISSMKPQPASTKDGEGTWNLGTIAARSSKTIEITGTAKAAGNLSSCTKVDYEAGLCANIPVVSPALQLVASGTQEMTTCDKGSYRYVITNSGTGTARDIVVEATLPKNLLTKGGKSTISKNIGSLKSGESRDFTVEIGADASGSFEHMASATAAGGLTAKSAKVTTVVRQPALKIEMTGSEKQFLGRKVKYTIAVSNTGNGVARDVVVEDTLPRGTKFGSASDGGRFNRGVVAWKIGDLKPAEKRELNVTLTADELGRIASRVSAEGDCATAVSATADTQIVGIPAILLEVVDIVDPIELGADQTYLVTVTNQGSAPATGVTIQATLPPNAEYVSSSGATRAPALAEGSLEVAFAALPSLAPKAEASWRIIVRGKSAADARFKVSMNSDQLTSPVEETEATTFYE